MDEQEPTMVSPAALAETGVVETAPTAWSDTDEIDEPEPYDDPRRRNWLISGVVFVATAAIAGLAAGGAYVFLHQDQPEAPAVSAPVQSSPTTQPKMTAAPLPPPVTVTTVVPIPSVKAQQPLPPARMAQYDQMYVARMQPFAAAEGSQITDPSLLVFRAHQTCAKLQSGFTDGALAQQLMEEFDLTANMAAAIVRNAMATYPNCP
ncbi:DUF732 domain-containing protein [Mycobacteroides abscessus]|uniref:DUF732 domain-containing protein n=1 Tax=Mycobacteroides abscessus TaxID=36809 RepID=UPI000D8E2708|nr:DUF732 domain-containing protein [Mycobacteroides abscessus]SPX87627.1 Uncharacterised protein [Mycobacteroides abscessus]